MGNQQLLGEESVETDDNIQSRRNSFDGNKNRIKKNSNTSASSSSGSEDINPYADKTNVKPLPSKKSKRKSRNIKKSTQKGYVSDAVISSTSFKKYDVKPRISDIPAHLQASSSNSIKTMNQENTEKDDHKDWWDLYNNGSIDKKSFDFIYLQKNSKYINELKDDFQSILELISSQIEIMNESENFEDIHPEVLHLLKEISFFGIDNLDNYSVLQANKLQKISCISMLSMMVDDCFKYKLSDKTIYFNIFELISFYYDLFWTSFAIFIKSNHIDKDNTNNINHAKKYANFPHFIFSCLFNDNATKKCYSSKNRSRINFNEYIASSFFMNLCITMKNKYSMENDGKQYAMQLIIPQEVLDGKRFNREDLFRRNAMASSCALLYMSAPKDQIEQYGMRLITVNNDLYDRLGDKTVKIVNDMMIENLHIIHDILNYNHLLWNHVIVNYRDNFEKLILHNEQNAIESSISDFSSSSVTETLSREVLFDDIVYFKYQILDASDSHEIPFKILNKYTISSKNVISKFYNQKNSKQQEMKEFEPNDQLPSFLNLFYNKEIGVIKTKFASKMISLICFQYDLFNYKKFIGQWFVLKGNLSMIKFEKKEKEKIGYDMFLYNELRCNIASFLMSNFRFFPSFDILLTLYHENKLRYITCHVNFEYLSNLFLIDNFTFDNNGKHLILNFNINVKKIRQAILYNISIATKKQRPPNKNEQIFIPFSWVENNHDKRSYSSIAQHIKNDLDSKYGSSDRFRIYNLKINSFTRNDVMNNNIVVLSSEKIPEIIVDRDAVYNNKIANSIMIDSYNIYGSNIAFDDKFNIDELSISDREYILSNIKHIEIMRKGNEQIRNILKCDPFNIGIYINNFVLFTHETTQIKCVDSFDINMLLKKKDFYNVIKQWSSLYTLWPLKTSEIIQNCCTIPKII